MPRLQSVRAKQKKLKSAVTQGAGHLIESLERRTLLNATLTSAISPIGVAPGGAPTTINLSQHFDDPNVPGTLVDVTTPLGVIPLALTDSVTPNTVANFLSYINGGQYAGTIFHRLASGFALQGGGYTADGNAIATSAAINGESANNPNNNNTTGTIAMALTSAGPNSATSQWFVNLGNNNGSGTTPNLNDTSDGGPFTVFGNVIYGGMTVVDNIAALSVVTDTQNPPGPIPGSSPVDYFWSQLPVLPAFTGTGTVSSVPPADLVTTSYSVTQPLTYTATSDNPSLVTPAISGSNLTLTYGSGTGNTQIHVTATDIAGNTTSNTFTVGVGIQSVTVGAGGVSLVRFLDSNGTLGHLAVTGKGSAVVSLIGASLNTGKNKNGVVTVKGRADSISVAATGTTPATVMTIFGSGGRALHLSDVTITGALAMLNAPGVAINGALTSTGAIHALNLGNVSGGTLTIGAGPGAFVHLGTVTNENLFSYANILRLTADSWIGTSQINAPTIQSARIGGSFAASLVVNSLGKFAAGAITGGTWSIPGRVEQMNVQTLTTWTGQFGSAGRVIVAGTVDASTLNTSNNIGLFASSGMSDSNVYAGADGVTSGLPAVTTDFTAPAQIGSFTVNGRFVNSNVAAQTLPKVNLGTVQTSNGGKPFGVAAHSIPDLLFAVGGKKVHVRKITTEAQVTAALAKNGVTPQDLVIRII